MDFNLEVHLKDIKVSEGDTTQVTLNDAVFNRTADVVIDHVADIVVVDGQAVLLGTIKSGGAGGGDQFAALTGQINGVLSGDQVSEVDLSEFNSY